MRRELLSVNVKHCCLTSNQPQTLNWDISTHMSTHNTMERSATLCADSSRSTLAVAQLLFVTQKLRWTVGICTRFPTKYCIENFIRYHFSMKRICTRSTMSRDVGDFMLRAWAWPPAGFLLGGRKHLNSNFRCARSGNENISTVYRPCRHGLELS